MDESSRDPLVKICGLTQIEDALLAIDAGADWLGLNFHPPSPRFLPEDRAAAMVLAISDRAIPVGLFVDRPPDEVRERAGRLGLTVVQLHGNEPPETIAALTSAGLRVVKAFRLADSGSIAAMTAYLSECRRLGDGPDAVLVDAYVAGTLGGTGREIDDATLESLPALDRLVLAGGLTPENVGARVAKRRPWMVDVAGGVESSPGRKDPAKVARFVAEARRGFSATKC